MLAPRLQPYATPSEVLDFAIELSDISKDDVVYDIGCGDGRFLIRAAAVRGCRCVGIEICQERVDQAKKAAQDAGVADLVTVICGNALELDYSEATVIYLALTTRGMRIVYPLLSDISNHNARVISYLFRFEGVKPDRTSWCTRKDESKFPMFLYQLPFKKTALNSPDTQLSAASESSIEKSSTSAQTKEDRISLTGVPA